MDTWVRQKTNTISKAMTKNEKYQSKILFPFILLFFATLAFGDLIPLWLFLSILVFLLLGLIYFEWWQGANIRDAEEYNVYQYLIKEKDLVQLVDSVESTVFVIDQIDEGVVLLKELNSEQVRSVSIKELETQYKKVSP